LIHAAPDGRFVYVDVNPTSEVAYGLPRNQVVGRTVQDILGQEQARVPVQCLRECIRTGAPQRYVAHRTLAGRTTTIDVMFVPVPRHDDTAERYIITTARDLTEREQLEQQLRQAQKMEAIGKLTGGVAHDFNNLLAVIAGNAELARRGHAVRVPRMLDNILRASERGVALTRQLLSFSRRRSANPQVVDLRTEVPRLAEMLRPSLRGDIRMTTTVAEDVWPVEVDLGECEIALLNVAANARDAMPGGGTFTIDVRNEVALPAQQDHVVITLRDTGDGIPPEIQGKVFDPFFTTKPLGEGTGLGLSQVYGFAQQSAGTVTIDSEPGNGTTVTLQLPRTVKSAAPADAADNDKDAPKRDETILLVEDNPDVAAVSAQMLRAMGFGVLVADRAQAALSMLDSGRRCDLLLTDVIMPGGMNGLDLARTVRQRLPELPIILVSGYNDVMESDSSDFLMLRKPVPFHELARCISGCLAPAAAPQHAASGP
jgi:PAS domain S-box-containing protein